MIKRLSLLGLACLISFGCFSPVYAGDAIAQTLQIYTHFKLIEGKPSWLLILRDQESGQVFPYLFDVKQNDNFWVAFSKEHDYKVTASEVKFGPCAVIHNFCHLQDGVLSGKSMYVTLSGVISPNRQTAHCHVTTYNDTHFYVVRPEDIAQTTVQTQQSTTQKENIPPAPLGQSPAGQTPTTALAQAGAAGAPAAKQTTTQQSTTVTKATGLAPAAPNPMAK